MYVDDCPKLSRQVLQNAGALVPGRRTYWVWQVGEGLSAMVTGREGAFELTNPDGSVLRVVEALGTDGAALMVCAHCGAHCHKLMHNGQAWRCRRCLDGLRYRTRSWPHPMYTRRSILRRLARADAGSLKEAKLKRKLAQLNAMTKKQARRVGTRCTYPGRQRSGIT